MKDWDDHTPLVGRWGQVRRWGALVMVVLVFAGLIAFPQPINLMTEIPGDEESARFPEGPYDGVVLWSTLLGAPVLAAVARLRNGFLVPLACVAAMLVSQRVGGMGWNRLLHHEGPFILLFGLPLLSILYFNCKGLGSLGKEFQKLRASTTGVMLEERLKKKLGRGR